MGENGKEYSQEIVERARILTASMATRLTKWRP